MAYFDCIVGGSGKGNTLVVTCADELAGATITCTNGTKTYRKTCPSTSPYEVTFYGLEAGTWTVSATVSGDTYTTTVVITDYEAELGGFNWKTWVDLSENYTSSDFTDLDDLLSDETAIRELMTIHDCVDYLAEIAAASADVEQIIENDYCAKWINNRYYALDTLYPNEIIADYMDTADKYFYGEWIITDNTTTPPTWGAKGNVPIMTSNTAPYGTASGTNVRSGYDAYKAFNNDFSANFESNNTTTADLIYKFVNPICVKRAFVCAAGGRTLAATVSISNDGTNYTPISEAISGITISGKTIDCTNDNFALYVKLSLSVTSGNVGVAIAQFYGRELSVSVPTMTSNTTPYGEAFASSSLASSYEAFHAFNGMPTSSTNYGWAPATNGEESEFGYEFTAPCKVLKMVLDLTGNLNSSRTFNIVVKASKDGTTYKDIKSFTASNNQGINYVDLDTDDAYKYYKVHSIFYTSQSYGFKAQFYGLDYSEREFESGVTKKWLYDHGLELVEISQFATTSGLAEKLFDELHTRVSGGQNLYGTFYVDNFACDIYELMYVKNGSIGYSSSGNGDKIGSIGVADDIQAVGYSSYALANKDLFIPLTTKISSLDITQISGNHKIFVGSGGYQSVTREMSITEWWLE